METRKALPEGWRWVALGNVADYVNGKAFKPEEWQSSGLPIVRIQNLNNDSASYNYYSGNVQDRYLIKDGDLLVSWSASLDAFIWNRGDAILNQHIFKVVENPFLVERKFLYFSIKNAMGTIKNQIHGATMQHITKPVFEAVKIPLPPLPEQKRIAAILKDQMAATEKARTAAQARLEAIKALPAAFLRQTFPQPDQPLPEGWRWAKLGEVAHASSGSSAPQGDDFFAQSGVPFVRVSDLSHCSAAGIIEKTRDQLSEKAISSCSLVKAPKGAVVFPKSGAAIATNRRAVLGMDAYIVGHLLALVAKAETVIMEWLYFAMCQINMMEYSDNSGYPTLKKSVVEEIKIPLPPLPEQKRIAATLKDQMAVAEKARTAAEEELDTINALPAALLRRAFNGEI